MLVNWWLCVPVLRNLFFLMDKCSSGHKNRLSLPHRASNSWLLKAAKEIAATWTSKPNGNHGPVWASQVSLERQQLLLLLLSLLIWCFTVWRSRSRVRWTSSQQDVVVFNCLSGKTFWRKEGLARECSLQRLLAKVDLVLTGVGECSKFSDEIYLICPKNVLLDKSFKLQCLMLVPNIK